MLDSLLTPELVALVQIIVIDIVMSGDNAIIIGLAAAGLPPELRKKAIIYGIVGATVLRIIFASVVVQLLSIMGIMLAGGLLLLWVCWRMWQNCGRIKASRKSRRKRKPTQKTSRRRHCGRR